MKNQLKKSLSLFMAVLMLLSCWVWVAPEEAEAGEITQYYMKITTNVTDTGNEDGSKITINYRDTNGKGDTGTFTQEYAQQDWEGPVTVYEGPINGWPTSFSWQFDLGGGRTENHRDITVWIGGSAETCTHQIAYSTGYNFINDLTGTNYLNCTMSITGTAPYFNEVTSIEAGSATVNKLINGADAATTVKVTGGKDQYGVVWKAALPTSGFSYSFKYTNASGSEQTLGTSYVSTSSTGNSATVYVKNAVQKLFPGAANGNIQAYCTYNNSTADATIKADFPTYKATFDSNGGLIGDDSASAKTQVEVTGDKMHYDSVIGKQPAFAAKDGFDFMGFYSNKNADATGKTASFSGTKFEDNVTKVPDTGDTTWYAAWQAKPVTATFVTADNQLIGTVEGRYNNYLTATNMYGTTLNAAVKAAYTGNGIQFDSNNAPIYKDGSTTYNFAGWKIIKAYDESVVDKDEDTVLKGDVTFQATYTKADAATYTVKFKNAEGAVVSEKSGYKYRDDVTNIPVNDPTKATDDKYEYQFIGWARDIGKNFYTVDETDRDENGVTVVYTHKDGASFTVKGDASYVPVFRMVPREYKVTYNYTEDNNAPANTTIEGYHWHDGVKMPEIKDNYTAGGYRYFLTGWKVGNSAEVKQLSDIIVEGDMTLTAVYGNSEAAKYTINFYGKDKDGETDVLLNEGATYEHGTNVTAPEVPQTIDTDEALYTFAGWSPEINTTANGDADYYATYTKETYADIHFYNYDGSLIQELTGKENGKFVGDEIPAYTGETPVKPEDVVGTYTFTGWADSKGNTVVPGTDKFVGDTYLYAQFETNYKEYTVKFVNEDKTVSETKYKYGEEILVPDDPTKAEDVEYTYEFKYWSPDVSEVCYGDATYTAVYERNPQYYTVTWFNDNKTVLSESNYKYNQKIQQAVVNAPLAYEDAAEGKTWAFKHWVQCNANGEDILVDNEQVLFVRGQRMPAEHLYFYPVFEEVDNVLTVTFYKEDGTTLLGEAKIPYGRDIDDYDDEFTVKAPKASDENYHYVIKNWVRNVENGAAVTTITADVAVRATYTAEAHDKKLYEVVAEPTANVPGYGHYKCEADECTDIDYNVKISPVADEGAPSGQIYVGSDKWTLDNYNAGINYDDVKFVNPNTQLIVNAKDTGSASEPWNSDGEISRGVGKIEYYVANGKIDDVSSITNWTEVYNYEALRQETLNAVLSENKITLVDYNGYIRGTDEEQMKKAEIDRTVDSRLSIYNANATGIVSNLNLINGKSYIIYIKVSDREGNGDVNTCIFSSGTISYGSNAAEITVTGDGYNTKFCADATVTVTDDYDGFKVYLDGEEVALTGGKFICNTKGVHTVTVIDKHGNKTTKTFEIKGNHTYRNYTTAATCENPGSRYDLCTVCGHKANETELPAIGHSYTVNYIDKAPDCVNDGYRTYVCDNNCGTKLVLNPTDAEEKVAQANKWDEKANDGKGAWVALTVADLEELKATGAHTYAKVKDENGEDTDVDAWIIDKAATCSVEGSKHKDCTVCGRADARVTEVIPLDKVNGHKFYREKVTKEPTCTEAGEKTKACRYCDYVETVEKLEALGHVAGEYKVTLAPTCEAKGSKILVCATCDAEIGEPVKDDKGNVISFDGKSVEIDALGHAWKLEGEVYEEAGKYYQNYVCKNNSEHTKREEVEDYEPPVAATITFDFNGGYYTIPAVGTPGQPGYAPEMLKGTQKISAHVGESIAAADVEKAFKLSNPTKTYTFAYWAIKNADGSYTEVKFPIEVKGDATYYAVYTEKFINYTITYYEENGTTEFKKTGYLHNGEEVTLADGPSKAETNLVTFKFVGWAVIGSDPEVVYTDKVTIDGANINLKAKYTEVKKQYAVTYAYSKNDILETFAVEAGAEARDCLITPVKDADSKYHYEFKAWNKAAQLIKVESNIYTTPDFEAVLHSYETKDGGSIVVKTPATCTTNRIDTYTCSCGYTFDKEAPNTARGHIWGDPVYDENTGVNIVECISEGCDVSQQDTRTFTAKFYVEAADAQAIKTISYITWGTKIDPIRLPADPTKDSTATTEYTFKGWAVKGDATNTIVDFKTLEVKQDYDFVAVFEGTTRTYNVIFAYDAKNIIKVFTDVPAGSDVTFDLTEKPVKAYDDSYHYDFSGWKGYDEGVLNVTVKDVQEDLKIYAEFTKTEHDYENEEELKQATCQNGAGTRYSCDCGAYYDVTGKPLDHEWIEVERVEATENKNGYIKSECENCGEIKTETLTWVSDKIILEIKVLRNGEPQANVSVQFVEKSASAIPFPATTGKDGVAKVQTTVSDYGYDCYVNIDGEMVLVNNFAVDANGNYSGTYSYTVAQADCSCACHRDNFWGTIFRFIHKIIKFFTGEFKCCGNPDPMYG